MRTYSRKRPTNQFIENVHELCRLCLNKALESMPIFTEDPNNVCATALRIMICVGLEIKREECLPNVICTECYNELNKYYAFRKKCEVTYQKLKSHVLAVKEREYLEKLSIEEAKRPQKVSTESEDDKLKFIVTEPLTDVGELNLNGVAQVNNFVETYPTRKEEAIEINEPVSDPGPPQYYPDGKEEILQINLPVSDTDPQATQEESDPDLTSFLSTMLLELGIITQQPDGLVYSNQSIKTLELETGDGSQVTVELVEEDDEPLEQIKPEDGVSAIEDEKDTSQHSDIVIKYVTSNAPRPKTQVTKKYSKTDKAAGTWCSQCGKRLASRSALTRHMRIHSGEKPFTCNECGRSFAQREVLVRHQYVHEVNRPYKCGVCSKSFTQRGGLQTHARQHAPPHARPLALHRCDRCPKVFLYASGLSRHMMMHNGRVYVCGVCERQFKDKSSLLRHLKNARHELHNKNNDNTNTSTPSTQTT